eukprot:TRINITY_DN28276_c0_g3_i2.p1 TRINITY_DN28276_c0_g3~~TRINITY_DN28276_c0_g3_i2.p1  ORF type:complete len:1092 (+),score=149.75 TRINITY_DN28276_c0_g3_i2:89-3364(+)
MPRCECPRWRRVPGYESDDDHADEEEEKFSTRTRQRLADITDVLSSRRWRDLPAIPFTAAPAQRNSRTAAAERAAKIRSYASLVPGPLPAFRVERVCSAVVHETFACNGLTPAGSGENWCVKWCGAKMKEIEYANLMDFQRVNHFPHSTELTRKDTMYRHLDAMAHVFGKEDFDFLPETYVLPEQSEAFRAEYARRQGLWIVKPTNQACGKGIFILRDLADLPLNRSAVVSRYVDNPLLIQGLKFDLRVYVLVTQYEPLRCYIYREGLARFASQPYSTESAHLNDVYRHLTNYSINKSAPNFRENQQLQADNYGHKWSLSALNKHLRCTGVDENLMWSRINDLIVKTLLAVEPSIGTHLRRLEVPQGACFELYGFDILVDDTLKPWILEVNMSPSMATESPLDWQVKSSLLSDAFNLVGVHQADYKAISLSRLELQMRERYRLARLRPPLQRDRGVIFPGLRRRSQASLRSHTGASNSGLLGSRAAPSPISEEPVQLNSLGDGELRFLVRSLQELSRCRNFIPLHPTRSTTECYAVITEARSLRTRKGKLAPAQLLASVLFGPAPVHGTPKLPKALSVKDTASGHDVVVRTQIALAGKIKAVAASRAQAAGRSSPKVGSEHTTSAPASDEEESRSSSSSGLEEEEESSDAEEEDDEEEDDSADKDEDEEVSSDEQDTSSLKVETEPDTVSEPQGSRVSAVGNDAPAHADKIEKPDADAEAQPPASSASVVSQPKDLSQLPMMEYLARICDYCEALEAQDRARLAQSAAFSRLSAFCGWLRRTVMKPELLGADAEGDLIDEIAATCKTCLASMISQQCTAYDLRLADTSQAAKPSSPSSLMRHLPPEFSQDAAIQRTIRTLSSLPDDELEFSVKRKQPNVDFGGMLRALSVAPGDGSGKATASRPYSPLAELLRARQEKRRVDKPPSQKPPSIPDKTSLSPMAAPETSRGVKAPLPSVRSHRSAPSTPDARTHRDSVFPFEATRTRASPFFVKERELLREREPLPMGKRLSSSVDFGALRHVSSLAPKRISRYPSAPSLPELRSDSAETSYSFSGYSKSRPPTRVLSMKDLFSQQSGAKLATPLDDHTTVEL